MELKVVSSDETLYLQSVTAAQETAIPVSKSANSRAETRARTASEWL